MFSQNVATLVTSRGLNVDSPNFSVTGAVNFRICFRSSVVLAPPETAYILWSIARKNYQKMFLSPLIM